MGNRAVQHYWDSGASRRKGENVQAPKNTGELLREWRMAVLSSGTETDGIAMQKWKGRLHRGAPAADTLEGRVFYADDRLVCLVQQYGDSGGGRSAKVHR